MLPPMQSELPRIARELLEDLRAVKSALNECEKTFARVEENYPDAEQGFKTSPRLALWAHCRFEGDWDKFFEFVCGEVDRYTDKSKIGQNWAYLRPAEADPEPGVEQMFDRINIATHFIAKELEIELPEALANGRFYKNTEVERALSFAESLRSVLGGT
jgi:hypothetical protein